MSLQLSESYTEKEEIEPIENIGISLQLGDVIFIKDPTNEILNENTFFIEYIDNTKIKIIGEKELNQVQLNINDDGTIGENTISEIILLSRNPSLGYAKQNQLLPNTWVNIYFSGEFPAILTGQITNLEEDMIELTTYPEGDVIYINFDYKGIPENIPIESIEIRPAPEIEKQEIPLEIEEQDIKETETEIKEAKEEEEEPEAPTVIQIPVTEVKHKLKQMILEADQIEFGQYLGNIKEFVDIDKEKYRFNIESQTNDLLEEMLSTIPNSQRTNKVLDNIHTMITRFLQLREMSSTFDKYKNIIGITKKTADDKPLVEYLSNFKNTLYWLLLVSKNIKKVYDSKVSNEEIYTDITANETLTDITEIYSLFTKYKNHSSNEEQNNYVELYSGVNNQLTPFNYVNPETTNDLLCEGEVMDDMNVIIDNLGELYSSIISKENIKSRRFVIQKYNLGLNMLHADVLKGNKFISHRVKLTKNDLLSVKSLVTLPEPTVRFSQINLPGSNIFTKSNLHIHFLNYWQLLKKNTRVTNVDIDGLDIELDFTAGNFVNDIKNYILNIPSKPENLSNLEIYKEFLKIIIPKIRVLFNLVKKYIKGKLSMLNVIQYLEPFLIYSNDLTYMQYVEINKFIREKISDYNRNFVENSRYFSLLRNLPIIQKTENVLFNILNENVQIKNSVFGKYGYEENNAVPYSQSELLKKIILNDFGNLYNTAIAFENISLMFPNELSSIFETDKDKLKSQYEEDSEKNKCSTQIIAKKYYSKEDLVKDNGITLYFDKEYDKTPYTLLDDYLKEQNILSNEEFELFLIDKLKTKYKYNEVDAEYIAESIIKGGKRVKDGQYAVLLQEEEIGIPRDTMTYYVRQNEEWQLDETKDPNTFITQEDAFCMVQKDCVYAVNKDKEEGACNSLEMTKDTIVSNALKQILDQFDKNYQISKEQLTTQLNKYLEHYGNIFDKLENIEKGQFFKYNEQKYKLGLEVSEDQNIVVSPYVKIRDLILGQPDYIKKQNDIIRFCALYTRNGNPAVPNINDGEMESIHWLYCNKTDTKLLPLFFYTLANTFITNNREYENVMNHIIKEIGTLSDDGDSWVDKYSGYKIKRYEDGFKIKSRAVLEEEITLYTTEPNKKPLSRESQLVSNIINSLSLFMNINLDNQYEFIIKVVTTLMNDTNIIPPEKVYAIKIEEQAKKGKKLLSYELLYNSTLIYLTLGMYLIGIQTSIPSIKTKKTFPGCVKSFDGFPIQGEGDYSGLQYLACVVFKLDRSSIPWNALSKVKEDIIADKIKLFIAKYLLENSDVELKMKEKIDYLLTNPEEGIPEEHELSKWSNFLPPLKKFTIKGLQNVSDGFKEEFKKDIQKGSREQFDKWLVVQSKILFFSFAIQEAIQKIVEKKNLLLKNANNPYMDNACCNENEFLNKTTLQYFIKDNSDISTYNTIVYKLTALLHDVKILSEGGLFYSNVNTKRRYPEITDDFDEETIYRGFITFCKFQSLLPINQDLLVLCKDKPEYINKNDSIQEQIAKLKRDGRNYTDASFLRLLQLVNRQNIIHVNTSVETNSIIENLRVFLEQLEDENDETIANSLRNKMVRILDTYDVAVSEDNEDMREMKNYLAKTNEKMRSELLDFIKKKARINKNELKSIVSFINNIAVWEFDEKKRNEDNKIADDAMYNYINYFKNFVIVLTQVFPNMLLKKKIQNIIPHKYWKLSRKHENDIQDIVKEYYEPLKPYYEKNILRNILEKIQTQCKHLVTLANKTPVLTEMKVGNTKTYSVFDKRICTLLYEYYILQVFTDYIHLTDDPNMRNLFISPMAEKYEDELYSTEFLVEQELRYTESSQEFMKGDISFLKENTANLLVAYIRIMIKAKGSINLSYDRVMDKVFKLKEREKDTFTDRLQDLTDEGREADNILKINKLGVWSKGLMKGLKEYDPENYDQEREIMRKISEIEKRVRTNADVNDSNVDIYLEDYVEDMQTGEAIDAEEFNMSHMNDDYRDGDYYGDEQENQEDYD